MTPDGAARRPRKIGRWILLGVLVGFGVRTVYRRSHPPRYASENARTIVASDTSAPRDTSKDTTRVRVDPKQADSVPIKPKAPGPPVHEIETIVRVVPEGTRIKVEVLNGTDVSGLARRGMFAMRDAGFDVVSFGSTKDRSDTTLVIDRTGHPEWAALAAKSLSGPVRITTEPDDSRFVDLSILLGRRWTPPREPFHP